MEGGTDELDGVGVIFGLDAAPGLGPVGAGTDREPRCVESCELILLGSGFVATDPPDEGRTSVGIGYRVDGVEVIAEVRRAHRLGPGSARPAPAASPGDLVDLKDSCEVADGDLPQ